MWTGWLLTCLREMTM